MPALMALIAVEQSARLPRALVIAPLMNAFDSDPPGSRCGGEGDRQASPGEQIFVGAQLDDEPAMAGNPLLVTGRPGIDE